MPGRTGGQNDCKGRDGCGTYMFLKPGHTGVRQLDQPLTQGLSHAYSCLPLQFLEERAGAKLEQFFKSYGPAEAAAMCILLATSAPPTTPAAVVQASICCLPAGTCLTARGSAVEWCGRPSMFGWVAAGTVL